MVHHTQQRSLALIIGLSIFTATLNGAELAQPVATPPTSSSWWSRLSGVAHWGVSAAKGIATHIALNFAPGFLTEQTANLTNAAFPPQEKIAQNHWARTALNGAFLAGNCLLLTKVLPLLTQNTAKPLSYYALLFPLLALGRETVMRCGTHVVHQATMGVFCGWSLPLVARLAALAGVCGGAFWAASHLPFLLNSYFFKSPMTYFSFWNLLFFSNHLDIQAVLERGQHMAEQDSAAQQENDPQFQPEEPLTGQPPKQVRTQG